MKRFFRFFERSGYLRAAAEMQRLGYPKQAANLKQQADNLGNH